MDTTNVLKGMKRSPRYQLKPVSQTSVDIINEVLGEVIFSAPPFMKWLHGFKYTRAPHFECDDVFTLLFSPRRKLVAINGGAVTSKGADRNKAKKAVQRYFQKLILGSYFSMGTRFVNTYGVPVVGKGKRRKVLYDIDYWTMKLCLELEVADSLYCNTDNRIFSSEFLPEDLFALIYLNMRMLAGSGGAITTFIDKVITERAHLGNLGKCSAGSNSFCKIKDYFKRNADGIALEILMDTPIVQIYSADGREGVTEVSYSDIKLKFSEEDYEAMDEDWEDVYGEDPGIYDNKVMPPDFYKTFMGRLLAQEWPGADKDLSNIWKVIDCPDILENCENCRSLKEEGYEECCLACENYDYALEHYGVDHDDVVEETNGCGGKKADEDIYKIEGTDFLGIDQSEQAFEMGAESETDNSGFSSGVEDDLGYATVSLAELRLDDLLQAFKGVGSGFSGNFINNLDHLRTYLLSKFTFIPANPIGDLRTTIMHGNMKEVMCYRRIDYRRSIRPDCGVVGTRMDELSPRVIIMADTSGSMTDEELMVCMNIAYTNLNLQKKTRVIQFSDGVTQDDIIDIGDKKSVARIGSVSSRAGTTIGPAIRYLKEQKIKYDVIIILTDGYVSDFSKDNPIKNSHFTGTPVFVMTNNHSTDCLDPKVKRVLGFFDIVKQHMNMI